MGLKPLISIVIPTYNRKQKVTRLIESIKQSTYPLKSIEVIVIDDASTDGTYGAIGKRFSDVKVIRNSKRRMPAGARNVGTKFSKGDYLFFVDDDYVIDRDAISELVYFMKRENVPLAAPIIYYYCAPQRIWYAGGRLREPLYITTFIFQDKTSETLQIAKIRMIECDFVSTPFMIRRQTMKEIGLFDERNFPIWGEEIDFSLRIRGRGYRQVIVPQAKVWHDIPTEKDYHLTEERAFFRGRSRVRFSLKYAPPRILLLPIDVLVFCRMLFGYNKDPRRLRKLYLYFRGIVQGLASWDQTNHEQKKQ